MTGTQLRGIVFGILLVSISACGILFGQDPCVGDPRFDLNANTSLRVGETTTARILRFVGVSSGLGGTGGVKDCPIRGTVTWRSDNSAVLVVEVPTGETTTVKAVGVGSATLSASESTPSGPKELTPLQFTVSP
jgi:hypothetical protein